MVATVWLLLAVVVVGAGAGAGGAVYRDASAPIPDRVADLLARMTTEEKIAQTWFVPFYKVCLFSHVRPAHLRLCCSFLARKGCGTRAAAAHACRKRSMATSMLQAAVTCRSASSLTATLARARRRSNACASATRSRLSWSSRFIQQKKDFFKK